MSEPWKNGWTPAAVPHGTTGGYGNWRCRCLECRAANTAAVKAWRRRKAAERLARGDKPVQPTRRGGVSV